MQQSSELQEAARLRADVSDLQQVQLMRLLNTTCVSVVLKVVLHSQHNQELNVQLAALTRSEAELRETNRRLRETLDRVREELRAARTQAERSQHEAERCLHIPDRLDSPTRFVLILCLLQADGVSTGGVAGGETPAAGASG